MRLTRKTRWRNWVRSTPAIVLWSFLGTALLALAIWALYAIMLGIESLDFLWQTDKP